MRRLLVCAAMSAMLVAAPPMIGGVARADTAGETRGGDGFAVFRWLVAIGLGDAARDRLVGQGGRWEQAAVPCERPKVFLALEIEEPTFALAIESRCRGRSEVLDLEGAWEGRGSDRLVLTFPEPDAADEELVCAIARCDDHSGEDCIRCQPAPDLAFELRVVRR
jgi:hypothetical protein